MSLLVGSSKNQPVLERDLFPLLHVVSHGGSTSWGHELKISWGSSRAHVLSFIKKKIIYLFLAPLGLCCLVQAFSSCSKWGYSSLPYAYLLWWLLLLQSMGFHSHGTQA